MKGVDFLLHGTPINQYMIRYRGIHWLEGGGVIGLLLKDMELGLQRYLKLKKNTLGAYFITIAVTL